MKKTTNQNFSMSPELVELLKKEAELEERSLSNMLCKILASYFKAKDKDTK